MGDTGAATVSEAERVHNVIKRQKFPRGIKPTNFEVKFGEDFADRPAMWILLATDRGFENPRPEWVREAREFVKKLRDDLLREEPGRWPYINLKPPA